MKSSSKRTNALRPLTTVSPFIEQLQRPIGARRGVTLADIVTKRECGAGARTLTAWPFVGGQTLPFFFPLTYTRVAVTKRSGDHHFSDFGSGDS